MGTLKPGATYIYEQADGVVYARESGADPATRTEVGWNYDSRLAMARERIAEDKLWGEIRRAAGTNPTLQDALNRVIMIYQLSNTDE